jgi:hypothetical protein
LVTKRVTQWFLNLSSRKSLCLTFIRIYFHPIFYCLFPQGVQILLQLFYGVFIFDFSIYCTVINEESNIQVENACMQYLQVLEICKAMCINYL